MAVQEHPRAVSPLHRRLWLAALCLYAAAGLADMAVHLNNVRRAGEPVAANIPVAFAAGLFWPADLVAQVLLAR
jgi:hypothetical protein